MRKAIIAGAAGLIGGNLLKLLLESPEYQEVISVSRHEIPVLHKKLVQLVINFDNLDNHVKSLNGDVLFCCIGTTRAKTPDKNQYRKIEYGYPVQLGEIAKANGIKQFHYVSSIGASADASSFYLKNKGEAEAALAHLNFPSLHIYQPSVLTGQRNESRPMEAFVEIVMKVINH